MRRPGLFFLLGLALASPARAQLWGLPGWAETVVREAGAQTPPEGADAWVLLDQTLLSYRGGGELRKIHTRVVRVLTKRGVTQGVFLSRGFGKTVSKIQKLKGWNLRRDGTTRKIDRDDLVSIDADWFRDRTVSSEVVSRAALPDVEVGSIIAFESQEALKFPMGPTDLILPLEASPIRRYRLEVEVDLPFLSSNRSKAIHPYIEARNIKGWAAAVQQTDRFVQMDDIVGEPEDEPWAADGMEIRPIISLRFYDPLLTTCPDLSNWDAYAKWVHQSYAPLIEPVQPVTTDGLSPRAALVKLSQWMRTSLAYRQVYLSPERGWLPERSSETLRRRYGDCKDLTACLLGGALSLRLVGAPVEAMVGRGRIPPDAPVNPYLANHILAAIRLEQSLGFPAEVLTPRGRFLLVDATARTTPLGWLPTVHRGARLLVCTAEGAAWVDVPDSALEEEMVDFHLEGRISLEGIFTGTLRITEYGNAMGLQSTALIDGAKGLQKVLLGFAPPTLLTRWEVTSMKPPAEPGSPFETTLRLEYTGAQIQKGREWELNLPSTLIAPSPLKRTAQKRRFPIEVPPGLDSRWSASLDLATDAKPLLVERRLVTPIREARWKAVALQGHLDLALEHHRKPARWSLEDQDLGLEALRKDRSECLRFLEETKTIVPPPGAASGLN